MEKIISKSEFGGNTFQYLRNVEETGSPLVITDKGRPVLKIVPYFEKRGKDILESLRDSVIEYKEPMEPVGSEEWEALK